LLKTKNKNLFYSIASFAALAAINYTVVHNPLVFLFLTVLLTHELGHYFFAKKYTDQVSLPIFIPIPFFAIAFTKVKGLTNFAKKRVSLAGPLVGSLTAILFIFANIIFRFTSYIPLFVLLFGEIVFNWLGTDGSKYRSASRSMSCTY